MNYIKQNKIIEKHGLKNKVLNEIICKGKSNVSNIPDTFIESNKKYYKPKATANAFNIILLLFQSPKTFYMSMDVCMSTLIRNAKNLCF